MKKILLIILTLFLFFINIQVQAASNVVKKEIKFVANDGFSIKSTLITPKVKGQKEFKTVVLLHSLGYNSQWWGDLPNQFTDKGYAVLLIDLRGHGGSVYNKSLAKVSWKSMTNHAYAKCPDDIAGTIQVIKDENPKKIYFNDWAIVGSDVGVSAGIMAADKLSFKPKTIVMISPVVRGKGLYIPVSIAQLDGVDFLSINGSNDEISKSAEIYLKKFAQNGFSEFVSDSKTSGMVLLKNDPEIKKIIVEWVSQYFQ